MNKSIEYIEEPHSTKILMSLLDGKKNYSMLTQDIEESNFQRINKTLKILKESNLTIDEKKEVSANGKYVGVPLYISLTTKGKRIAEKLIEIVGIEKKMRE